MGLAQRQVRFHLGNRLSGIRVHQVVTPFTVTFALIWTPTTGIFLFMPGKAQSTPANPAGAAGRRRRLPASPAAPGSR